MCACTFVWVSGSHCLLRPLQGNMVLFSFRSPFVVSLLHLMLSVSLRFKSRGPDNISVLFLHVSLPQCQHLSGQQPDL